MDRTVPIAAARILDFIGQTEVGTDGPSGYNVIYGHNQDKLPKPITQMTVDELIGAQSSFTRRFGSSASGRYQFMKATLTDLKRELGLRGSQVMDPDLQDRLGFHLLKRRGYEQFMAGTMSLVEFGKRLAMEWASFPVLADTKGAHRQVTRGTTYYSGDKLNKALVGPEEIEALLRDAKELGDAMPAPAPVPTPRPEPSIGHNGGPALDDKPLSPVEQSNKAAAAGKAVAAVGALWTTISSVIMATPSIPDPWRDPALLGGIGTILTTLAGIWATYMARDYRITPKASQ